MSSLGSIDGRPVWPVVVGYLVAQIGQRSRSEHIDPAEQMVSRDALVEVELVEQPRLGRRQCTDGSRSMPTLLPAVTKLVAHGPPPLPRINRLDARHCRVWERFAKTNRQKVSSAQKAGSLPM